MRETGGPAFPHADGSNFGHGMTIRDYFAAKAMQGLSGEWTNYVEIAERSYALADAMLAERAK